MIHDGKLWLAKLYYKSVIWGWKAYQFVKHSFTFLGRWLMEWMNIIKTVSQGWTSISETPEVLVLYLKSGFIAVAYAHRRTQDDFEKLVNRHRNSVAWLNSKNYIEYAFAQIDSIENNHRYRSLNSLLGFISMGLPPAIEGEYRHVDER